MPIWHQDHELYSDIYHLVISCIITCIRRVLYISLNMARVDC